VYSLVPAMVCVSNTVMFELGMCSVVGHMDGERPLGKEGGRLCPSDRKRLLGP